MQAGVEVHIVREVADLHLLVLPDHRAPAVLAGVPEEGLLLAPSSLHVDILPPPHQGRQGAPFQSGSPDRDGKLTRKICGSAEAGTETEIASYLQSTASAVRIASALMSRTLDKSRTKSAPFSPPSSPSHPPSPPYSPGRIPTRLFRDSSLSVPKPLCRMRAWVDYREVLHRAPDTMFIHQNPEREQRLHQQ